MKNDTLFLTRQRNAYKLALEKCCKYLRENPPGDLDNLLSHEGMINILAGGGFRDPEGSEWVTYWLHEAITELREEEENDIRNFTVCNDCGNEE